MNRRVWTTDEDRVLRWAHRRGVPLKHVCAPLERSYGALRHRVRFLGLWWRERRAA